MVKFLRKIWLLGKIAAVVLFLPGVNQFGEFWFAGGGGGCAVSFEVDEGSNPDDNSTSVERSGDLSDPESCDDDDVGNICRVGIGECMVAGLTVCAGGGIECVGAHDRAAVPGEPADEICNGLDDDCDGVIDEGCECSPGETAECGTDVGACRPGIQICGKDGVWGTCDGIGPAAELCNGLDDDCDGSVDEGFAIGASCDGPDSDLCSEGVTACRENGQGTTCTDTTGDNLERCNGVDDDCDGIIDEGCECQGGESRRCGTTDTGACEFGTQTCDEFGVWGECQGGVDPITEVCDDTIDNDCDGSADCSFERTRTIEDPGLNRDYTPPPEDDLGLADSTATVTSPTFVAYSATKLTATSTTSTTITINVPAGIQNGDLLIAHLGLRYSEYNDLATPAGWRHFPGSPVQITDFTKPLLGGGFLTYNAAFLYKIASNEPAGYTFRIQGKAARLTGAISVWRGVNPDNPINASQISSTGSGKSTSHIAAGVTTTVDKTRLIALFSWAETGSLANQSSLTKVYQEVGGTGAAAVGAWQGEQTTAGWTGDFEFATGPRNATNTIRLVVALEPAPDNNSIRLSRSFQ